MSPSLSVLPIPVLYSPNRHRFRAHRSPSRGQVWAVSGHVLALLSVPWWVGVSVSFHPCCQRPCQYRQVLVRDRAVSAIVTALDAIQSSFCLLLGSAAELTIIISAFLVNASVRLAASVLHESSLLLH